MGRRARARERAAAIAPGPAPTERPGGAGAGPSGWRGVVGALNPFKLRPPSRNRVRFAAAGFGLSAALFAGLGWLTGEAAWFNSAVLLGALALAWGARAAFMREGDRSS